MISLTPDEERLRDYLGDLAAQADASNPAASAISYTRLAEELDPNGDVGWKRGHPRYSRLVTALYHVSKYEVEHGRPMPSAFVVHKRGDRQPGSGLALLGKDLGRQIGDGPDADYKFWQSEMKAMVEYWSAQKGRRGATNTDAKLTDTQFDAIMSELSKIKQMLREVLHG